MKFEIHQVSIDGLAKLFLLSIFLFNTLTFCRFRYNILRHL